jgi:3-dehydroquinate synthetase
LLSEKIFGLTKEIREYVLWIMKNLSLPYKTDIEPKEILKHMKYDKKNTFGEIHYVLLKELGEPVFGQKINENLILEVLAEQQQI